MKIKMKMKTPLWPILKLLGLLVVCSSHAVELILEEGETWSLNGGVFQSADQFSGLSATLHGKVLIKGLDGQIRSVEVGDGGANHVLDSQLLVDRKAPNIDVTWEGALSNNDGVVIGPNSHLNLNVDEGEITWIKIDEKVYTPGTMLFSHHFSSPTDTITIEAQDLFDNKSIMTIEPQADFQAPEWNWILLPPAINKAGKWYAGETAGFKLMASDSSGVEHVKINRNLFDWENVNPQISINSAISVSDSLGNVSEGVVTWQQDLTEPVIMLTVDGQPMTAEKFIALKINALIEVEVVDTGVGLKTQKYRSKSRNWQDLPKKFRFTTKGKFSIQVFAEDLVGNIIEKRINLRVKK